MNIILRNSSTLRFSFLAALVLAGVAVADMVPPAQSPEASVKALTVADGLEVKVVASEPQVRKPVTLTFDDRGRMWTISYIQYPSPNGLKPVSVDQYLRTEIRQSARTAAARAQGHRPHHHL